MVKQQSHLKSYVIIATLTLLFFLVFSKLYMLARVDGISMQPTLNSEDAMLVSKWHYYIFEPTYNDLVVIDYSASNSLAHKYLVKRIIGLPGDRLEFKGNHIYRNGHVVDEDYLKEKMIGQIDKVIDVPDHKVFVMGDNRNESIDSRHFGYIDIQEQIIGKVILY